MTESNIPKDIGSSKLGFFSKPELIRRGEFAGKVMKSYAYINNRELCEKVLENHNTYVHMLRKAGIKVPQTKANLIERNNRYSIRIYQQAFSGDHMARKRMESGSENECVQIMEGVLSGAIQMLNYLNKNPNIRLGFHPTLRNYSVEEDGFWYFDTFPPMASISQDELEWFILHFSPYRLPKWLKKLAKPFMHKVTDEYYHADKMYLGIIGSSCRLRPEFTSSFLNKAKQMLEALENVEHQKQILNSLNQPPKLPFIWVLVRKILGKEGKGNV